VLHFSCSLGTYLVCICISSILGGITCDVCNSMQQKYGRTTGISFSTPELKIFFVFCVLLAYMIVVWTFSSIENGRFHTTFSYMLDYIHCMSGGIRKDLNCEGYRRRFLDRGVPGLQLTFTLLYTLLTFSNLLFIIQFRSVRFFVSRKISFRSKRSLLGSSKGSSTTLSYR